MGGGAGIGFEVKLESIALKWTGEKWEVSGPVEIDSWRAEDYMNALGNIRPDLLKIVSVDITESDPDPEYAKRAHEIHGEFVHTDTGKVEGSMFSGYTRGKWEDRFPLGTDRATTYPVLRRRGHYADRKTTEQAPVRSILQRPV